MTSWAAHWMTHGRHYAWCPWCRIEEMELQPMTEPTPATAAPEAVDTRLVLVGPDGNYLRDPGGHLVGVVLTTIPNADARAPISLEVEQQCDMQHWHVVGKTPLPNYSGAVADYSAAPPAETTA